MAANAIQQIHQYPDHVLAFIGAHLAGYWAGDLSFDRGVGCYDEYERSLSMGIRTINDLFFHTSGRRCVHDLAAYISLR